MKAVIMAGGLGERLKPLTKIIPKPLLPVGDKSLLEIQIINLKSHGATDIFLALGYKYDLFQLYFGDGSRWGIKLRYSVEEKPLGTAGPLTLLVNHLTEPFLVMNGDIFTDMNYAELQKAHIKSGAAVTVVTKEISLPLQYGIIKHRDNRIFAIEEKPALSAEINAGIYFMNPEVLGLMPAGTPYSMDELLRQLITDGGVVSRYLMTDHWLDIGQMADYEKANDLMSEKKGQATSL
jgi:NDP-sugar pyrophosphorylase family protein